MKTRRFAILILFSICALTRADPLLKAASAAAYWPQWRGPAYNGASMEKDLPENFFRSNGVKWAVKMPGPSAATPAIWGDRVFVSSTDKAKRSLLALCLDRRSGQVLWQEEVAPGYSLDEKSTFASPSPVTDGKMVYFFYGNGELVAFEAGGKKLWSRNLQKDYGSFAFQWTFGSSPTLDGGKLYLQILQRDVPVNGRGKTGGPIDSFLLALDPRTGKEFWKQSRPNDARMESKEAYSTPIPFTSGGRRELLITGGDCITGHDPDTGKELWRWGTWNPSRITHWRLVPSPVAGDGVILACGPKGAPVFAVKAGLNGLQEDGAIAWKSENRDLSSDVPTPLFYRGKFFVLNGTRKKLFCVNPADGKIAWEGDLKGSAIFEASPTAGDGKIYVMNHRGEVFVIAADAFKVLGIAEMGDESDTMLRSSIAIAQGNIFIRTGSTLYCVGK